MGDKRDRLTGLKCKTCGKLYIPPVYSCSECGQSQFEEVGLTGKGTIRTYTVIRIPPLGFEDEVPYSLAVVELEEGVNVTARIVASNRGLSIGAGVTYEGEQKGGHCFKMD
jgi:hypothetical protein